jgi:hypothetical protein
VSGQFHTPAALPPEKEPLVPIDRRLGGPQSQSGCSNEEKNAWTLPGIKPMIIQPIPQGYAIELSRLLMLDVQKSTWVSTALSTPLKRKVYFYKLQKLTQKYYTFWRIWDFFFKWRMKIRITFIFHCNILCFQLNKSHCSPRNGNLHWVQNISLKFHLVQKRKWTYAVKTL